MSGRTPRDIAILMGGFSAEREVSLSSGRECAAALRAEGFAVREIDAGRDLAAVLDACRPDVVFNALHGRWGEDGCVQGLLEWLRLPYTHSGVLASALAMDKTRAKAALRAAGLRVPEGRLVPRDELAKGHPIEPPYVIKPNAEGSSVGIHIVRDASAPPPAPDAAMPEEVLVEAFIPGRELTTTVMGDRALGVTEVITADWYDYEAKYAPGGSRHVVPAEIPAAIAAACCDMALAAHRLLGCRGLTRTDFRWDESRGLEGLHVLELNTQPGMTPTSLAPEQARAAGIGFGALCRWLVEDASCDR